MQTVPMVIISDHNARGTEFNENFEHEVFSLLKESFICHLSEFFFMSKFTRFGKAKYFFCDAHCIVLEYVIM